MECHEIVLGSRRREGREREDEFFFERSTRENDGSGMITTKDCFVFVYIMNVRNVKPLRPMAKGA